MTSQLVQDFANTHETLAKASRMVRELSRTFQMMMACVLIDKPHNTQVETDE